MARGKLSLVELTDPKDVIATDEITGNIPFFYFSDECGIATDVLQYILVRRKQASKKGKEELGESPDKVYTYYRWEDLKYSSTIEGIVGSYISLMEKEKLGKLSTRDFKELVAVKNEIKEYIKNVFSSDGINKEVLSICSLLEDKSELKNDIAELKDMKNKINDEYNSLHELIVEKRRLIIKDTEPKKHRTPKE